ncbi:aminopeptidase [Streptomyces abyssalis]|uniref:Aminopeptidase n=1 Tax=Streptomyces abyssalis TaxID=933944 RepID=A0A1E7JVN9_9ACTN|nr:aminopeptidase [Streptomyces abyssalis]OEU95914.1 aminopeptidase [Streptomyces abyssalis]
MAAVGAAALTAGFVLVPPAFADARSGQAQPGGGAEARGVKIAAARAAKEGVDWKDCPEDWGVQKPVQCGFVTVPVDYSDPGGRTIKIAVDRAESTGAEKDHQGSLLYNPGGPGGSGLSFPTRITKNDALWKKAAKAYDFVGFDPRGVGHSAPVSCMDPQEYVKAPKQDPVPGDEADKRAQRKLAEEYAEGCKERSGGLLPHMTTPNTARDLDVIRAALGEKKLNYLGVSYGTYLGSVYGTLFPAHVRRMILDSVVNPSRDQIWYKNNLDQNVAFQGRWEDWTKWVAEHDETYGIGDTAAKVNEQWKKLRAEAAKKPFGGVVGPAELLTFFQNAPYYDQMWPQVAKVWSDHRKGNEKALVEAAGPDLSDKAGNKAAENGNAVYTAVECTDAKWPAGWDKWDSDSTRLHEKHPFLTWSNTWLNLPCATWPVKQQEPVEVGSGEGLPPVLITQSERDAATPYGGALEVHKRLKGSRLITERDAGSHGITDVRNPCINKRVETYLLEGTVGGKDVVCAPHSAPVPQIVPSVSLPEAKAGAARLQGPR